MELSVSQYIKEQLKKANVPESKHKSEYEKKKKNIDIARILDDYEYEVDIKLETLCKLFLDKYDKFSGGYVLQALRLLYRTLTFHRRSLTFVKEHTHSEDASEDDLDGEYFGMDDKLKLLVKYLDKTSNEMIDKIVEQVKKTFEINAQNLIMENDPPPTTSVSIEIGTTQTSNPSNKSHKVSLSQNSFFQLHS